MNTIAVIGAGTMGNGIAHTFAQSGFTVKLIDISEKSIEKGMATIAANLDRMVAKGSITEEDKHKTIGNIITYTDVKDGVVLLTQPSSTYSLQQKFLFFSFQKAIQFRFKHPFCLNNAALKHPSSFFAGFNLFTSAHGFHHLDLTQHPRWKIFWGILVSISSTFFASSVTQSYTN
jgi:hypothetical protein